MIHLYLLSYRMLNEWLTPFLIQIQILVIHHGHNSPSKSQPCVYQSFILFTIKTPSWLLFQCHLAYPLLERLMSSRGSSLKKTLHISFYDKATMALIVSSTGKTRSSSTSSCSVILWYDVPVLHERSLHDFLCLLPSPRKNHSYQIQ